MILKETLWAGRRWVEVALFLFVVGLLLGLTVAQTDPEEVLQALQPVLSQIGGIGEQVTAADGIDSTTRPDLNPGRTTFRKQHIDDCPRTAPTK